MAFIRMVIIVICTITATIGNVSNSHTLRMGRMCSFWDFFSSDNTDDDNKGNSVGDVVDKAGNTLDAVQETADTVRNSIDKITDIIITGVWVVLAIMVIFVIGLLIIMLIGVKRKKNRPNKSSIKECKDASIEMAKIAIDNMITNNSVTATKDVLGALRELNDDTVDSSEIKASHF